MPLRSLRLSGIWPGLAWLALAAWLFALAAVGVRYLSADASHEQIVFFRYLVGLLLLLPWLLRHRGRGLATDAWPWHLARAGFGFLAMFCYFYGIAHLPLANAILFVYAAPVLMPFLAHLLLAERADRRAYWAVAIGLLGIVLILQPGGERWTPVYAVALASTVFTALAFVSVRRLARSEPPVRIVFYFTAVGTVIAALPLIWAWQPLTAVQVAGMAGVGALTTSAQWCLAKGYSYAPAAQLAPATYLTVVFGGLWGWWLWAEVPGLGFIAGAGLVVLAALLNGWRPQSPPQEAPPSAKGESPPTPPSRDPDPGR